MTNIEFEDEDHCICPKCGHVIERDKKLTALFRCKCGITIPDPKKWDKLPKHIKKAIKKTLRDKEWQL